MAIDKNDTAAASDATNDPAVNQAIIDNVLTGNAAGAVDPTGKGVSRTDASESNESIRMIPIHKLVLDLGRNPRRMERYSADGEAGEKARSLIQRGLVTAIVVSERADGTIVVLQGHIRVSAMLLVRSVGLPAGTPKADKPTIEPDPHFFDKVRCLVKRGLSLQAEMDLVMDHGESFPLDKREKYQAAARMLRMGFSQDFTAKKLGFKSRGPLAKLSNVAQMPQIVEDLFLADPKAEDYKDLTDTTIDDLYKAYNADQKLPGARIKVAGPSFNKVLEGFLANGPALRDKSIPRKDLLLVVGQTKDIDLRELLEGVANGDKDMMNSAYERVTIRLETERDTRLNGGVTRMFNDRPAETIEPTVSDENEDESGDDA